MFFTCKECEPRAEQLRKDRELEEKRDQERLRMRQLEVAQARKRAEQRARLQQQYHEQQLRAEQQAHALSQQNTMSFFGPGGMPANDGWKEWVSQDSGRCFCLCLCLCMCVHTKGGKWRQGLLKSVPRQSSRIPHSTRGQTG